jgi:hypothetical protein
MIAPERLAAVVDDMLQNELRLDPLAIWNAYQAFHAEADSDCPGIQTYADNGEATTLWFVSSCTTASGVEFRGFAQAATIDRTLPDGTIETGFSLHTGGNPLQVVRPDGGYFLGSFALSFVTTTTASGTAVSAHVAGDVVSNHPATADHPWLSGAAAGSLSGYASETSAGRTLAFAASVSIAGHPEVGAITFDGLGIDNTFCPLAVYGDASLRDHDGGWYDVSFAADDLADACDTCGGAVFESVALGEACLTPSDVAALLDWQVAPW